MAKHHKGGEGLILAAGAAIGGYLLWEEYKKKLAATAATPAAAGATPSSGSASILTPAGGSGALFTPASAASSAAATVATTPALIPALPLNSIGTLVGTTSSGVQVVEQGSVSTPYGTVIPSNFATTPNPQTGAESPVDIVPETTSAQVIQVPTPATAPALQTSTALCPNGTPWANNNPTGVNQATSYSTLQAGLVAAFKMLKAIWADAPNAFTISSIANNWVNRMGDGLAWGSSNPGSTQVTFENSMVSLTGFPDYALDPDDKPTMIMLMRGIIGTVGGAQYFGTLSDACLGAAFDAS